MKNIKNISATLCVALFTGAIAASGKVKQVSQDESNPKKDTLVWQYTSLKNMRNGEVIDLIGKFIVNGKSTIEWIQKGGEENRVFQVSGISGSWENINQPGTITYFIKMDQSKGNFIIIRTDTSIMVSLSFDNSDRPDTAFEFYISNVEKLTR